MAKDVSKKGVRVYWINSGSNTVGSDIAVSFDKTDVWFDDDGAQSN